ncbi:MAG: hypothetical protein DHS20C18_44890 [Saprospiraceae bacterium]|nr:MAG: hypothetical protein DHS20C18_44890 [Saprospiraceae bacterium]
MKDKFKIAFIFFGLILGLNTVLAQNHPNLILTEKGVEAIKASLGKAPLFDKVLAETIAEVDAEMATAIEVPIPKDMSGGYTHERHKKNWFMMQKAGVLYQITDQEKYAVYIRDMLLEYAKMYPKLPIHPTDRSYSTGKIFWQCLNDANWLVYTSQAYDCIYNFLTENERKHLEKDLFRPYADFLSTGNPQFFNRIHNHSTWGNAAVGMIGLVMNDKELVERALYGLKVDVNKKNERDNDGGLIRPDGQKKAGFLAQLDDSFSPDGYFTEGPYYLRYAIFPFLQFAKSLANNRPELDILTYRDSILKKAVYALLYQTDKNGLFFPINDAQKGMSWNAREVIMAVDLAYQHYGEDPMLLSVAEKQGTVILDEAGFMVARDLAKGLAQPMRQKSIAYTDGPNGDEGGIGILRNSTAPGNELCLVMKYSAQGMGHGHFDKLSYSLYDETGEIMQDYGAARWVNIDQKGGGRYLKENNTWAKQSIAHNTLVINETSHYDGDIRIGEKHHPDLYYFHGSGPVQVVSAKSKNAYPDGELHRTMVLVKEDHFRHPILIDVFRATSAANSQYDLPVWFQGHLLRTNFAYDSELTTLNTLGDGHGYQHLWKEAVGKTENGNAYINWFSNGKFYSMMSAVDPEDELIFARLGANDPDFNLRHDPAFIIRKKDRRNAIFVSIIEPHGAYNPVAEIAEHPFTSIEKVSVLHDDAAYTVIQFNNKAGKVWTLFLANKDASKEATHTIEIKEKTYEWQGPFRLRSER